MKKFDLTTNQLLDYLIEKLVQGEEVYIDLITKDISTSFLCLDDIESKEQRKAEAHKLLDCYVTNHYIFSGRTSAMTN